MSIFLRVLMYSFLFCTVFMFWYQGNTTSKDDLWYVSPSIFWKKICRIHVILDVPDLSFITSFLLEELPAVILSQSYYRHILLASLHLRLLWLHLHDRRIFSLSIEFGVASSFLSVLKMQCAISVWLPSLFPCK